MVDTNSGRPRVLMISLTATELFYTDMKKPLWTDTGWAVMGDLRHQNARVIYVMIATYWYIWCHAGKISSMGKTILDFWKSFNIQQ